MARFLTCLFVALMTVTTLGCQSNAELAEDRQQGFHCLSAWDGSHADVVALTKGALREPDSFEHISTRVTPVDEDGLHRFIMEYRARNGFGGMNVAASTGSYINAFTAGSTAGAIDIDACAVLDWTTPDDGEVHYTTEGIAFLAISRERERARWATPPSIGITGFEYEMRGDDSVPNQIEVIGNWLFTEEERTNGAVVQTVLLPSSASDRDPDVQLGLSFMCERNDAFGVMGPMFLHLAFSDNAEARRRFVDGALFRFDDGLARASEYGEWSGGSGWLNWQQAPGDDEHVDTARDIFIRRMEEHQTMEVRILEEGPPFEEAVPHDVVFELGNTTAVLDRLEFCDWRSPE